MQRIFMPEGRALTSIKNRKALSSLRSLEEAAAVGTVLEGLATNCDPAHNLYVDLGVCRGIIPRCEGAIGIAEGLVRDIALISRVGKPVSFVVDGFSTDSEGRRIALLSRRKAQQYCTDEFIKNLRPGDIIPATVTHLESFGAFCDIGCGCVALLPIDAISVSRISHPGDRFSAGDEIRAVIKSIADGKITLTMKELLGTWQQNADRFITGETVTGLVRSVEPYGIFVELSPNLAGLAELKDGVKAGQKTCVYIKSILPDKMKVKLIIIDSFEADRTKAPLTYFIKDGHIDRWSYSPENCVKSIVSTF
ncbi:MAG: S1 RNA-binding domain-containing protein [Clostridia bacterium]|nr:S1 RNA-binding domain-containing protein [Clostridia bacterium]